VYRYNTGTQATYISPETTQSNIILSGTVRVKGATNILYTDYGIYSGQNITTYNNTIAAGQSGAAASIFTGLSTGGLSLYTGQSSGALAVGGTAATGNITIGQSTAAQALGIASGATAAATTKTVNIGTNGTTSSITTINIGSANTGSLGVLTINSTQTIVTSTTTAISTNSGALQVRGGVGIGGNLNVGGVTTMTSALYINSGNIILPGGLPISPVFNIIQNVNATSPIYNLNANTGTAAESDIVVLNDQYTGQSVYGDFGINSSNYVGSGAGLPLNDANGTYLYAAGGTLTVGTDNAFDLKLITNSTFRITVNSSTGVVTVFSTASSRSTNTGALQIVGGIGVGGGGYFGGTVTATSIVSTNLATAATATTIASSSTIAPTARITFVSGTAAISTITATGPLSLTGGYIVLIPTGLWTTTSSGNIALASTAVVNRALTMHYDAFTAKWYPSY
jgi:hypothetical protein